MTEKTKETKSQSRRESSMYWWSRLSLTLKMFLLGKYSEHIAEANKRNPKDLTGNEIEKIWEFEMGLNTYPQEGLIMAKEATIKATHQFSSAPDKLPEGVELWAIKRKDTTVKHNQKRFEKFEPSVFIKFTEKFDLEGLVEMYKTLGVQISIRNSKKS